MHFGLWSEIDYIVFIQLFQTLVLASVLSWMFIQYWRTRSPIILLIAVWFALVYHGGSGPVTNSTQALPRRFGLILFLLTLPFFGSAEKKSGNIWILAHGILIGVTALVSVELASAILIAGTAFWGLSESARNLNRVILKCALFVAGMVFSGFIVAMAIALSVDGNFEFPFAVLMKPFSNSITSSGFGGLPLELSPLVVVCMVIAIYALFNCSRKWATQPVTETDRLCFACVVLFLLMFVYYLQRNALSSFYTPLIPVAFLCVFSIRKQEDRISSADRSLDLHLLSRMFAFILMISHFQLFLEETKKMVVFARDRIAGEVPRILPSCGSSKLLENFSSLPPSTVYLVTPTLFQQISAEASSLSNIMWRGYFDIIHSVQTKSEEHSVLKGMFDATISIIIDKRHTSDQFIIDRYNEIEETLAEVGYRLNATYSTREFALYQKTQAQN